ncbi:hypothetical protein AAEY33_22370 [Peribacillus simplex]|uniref:hypothetical protein n=1 Tax=Peribacillus simplex TaxID=1478 RepID=UPI003266F7A0
MAQESAAGLIKCSGLMFFYCNPHWIEEICDTPAELLASRDTTGACAEEAWQAVGGKGADF